MIGSENDLESNEENMFGCFLDLEDAIPFCFWLGFIEN